MAVFVAHGFRLDDIPVAKAIRLLAAREERSQSDVAGEALTRYLLDRQEHLDWLRASEPEVDSAYDAL